MHNSCVPSSYARVVVVVVGPALSSFVSLTVGFNTLDNGYARFTHVRVPRDHMLMRYASVQPDGAYVPPVHKQVQRKNP